MQTIIQNEETIRVGSVLLEVGATMSSLVNLGALRDVAVEQQGSSVSITFDNVDEIKKYRDADKFRLTANLAEINFDNLALINAGQISVTNVAGTAVTGYVQTFSQGSFEPSKALELDKSNATGLAPTVTAVTGSVAGAITGYSIVKLANGKFGLVLPAGTSTSQNVSVTYNYTPTASKEVVFNGVGTHPSRFMRITNTDEDGKKLIMEFRAVANMEPIKFDFPADTEDDVMVLPIALEGYITKIVDEQGI